MHALYLFSVWLHVLAAMLWVGGMLFLVFVLVPVLRGSATPQEAARFVRATGQRFRSVGWAALLALVATGFANIFLRGVAFTDLASLGFWTSTWGHVLGAKLALVVIVLILSLVHDFNVGPSASEALAKDPRSPEALRLRKMASWMGRFNLLLGLAIVALGVWLARLG
jgi:copper resistance protein D